MFMPIFSINAFQLKPATVTVMNKRAMAIRRRMMRKVGFGLLLAGIVSLEALGMGQIMKATTSEPVQSQLTIDPTVCFQGW